MVVTGQRLDSMILKVYSNPIISVIIDAHTPLEWTTETQSHLHVVHQIIVLHQSALMAIIEAA